MIVLAFKFYLLFCRNILQCKLVNAGCCRLIKLNCLSFISLVLNDNKRLIKVTQLLSSFLFFFYLICKSENSMESMVAGYNNLFECKNIGKQRKIDLELANWHADRNMYAGIYVTRFIFESIAIWEFYYIGMFRLFLLYNTKNKLWDPSLSL